jgi:starch phosphorylase
MKSAINGGIHLSILDGWWCEGYHREGGWAIGAGETYGDEEYQDSVEAQALYNLIENEIVPRFYDRQAGDVPTAWVKMMKASIRMGLAFFTSHRMVAEYAERFYRPAAKQNDELLADRGAKAEQLARQRERLTSLWPGITVGQPVSDKEVSVLHVNEKFKVTVAAHLGGLDPKEVSVEVYHGPVDSHNLITNSLVEPMKLVRARGDGSYEFEHEVVCDHTGRYGFTARATPAGDAWGVLAPSLVTWADGH